MEKISSLRDFQKLYSFNIKPFYKEEGLLYRYDSIENALKLLEDETIYFQTPNNFNDPYELHEGLFNLDLTNWTQFSKRNRLDSSVINHFSSLPKEKFKSYVLEFIRELREEESGVYCLTKNKNDLLMWSHYTNKHQGVSFGLDFSTEVMTEKYNAILLSVGYIKNVIPLINIFNRENVTDIILWYFLKFEKWEIENEVRLFKNQYKETLKIDLNHIKEIYLGCNINKDYEESILSIIRNKNLNVRIYKNEVSKDSFGLESIRLI